MRLARLLNDGACRSLLAQEIEDGVVDRCLGELIDSKLIGQLVEVHWRHCSKVSMRETGGGERVCSSRIKESFSTC